MKDSIGIPPTINVDQGTRIIVFVKKDLDFSSLYPDPVKEALYELKHPGKGHGSDGAAGGALGIPAGLLPTGGGANTTMVTKP